MAKVLISALGTGVKDDREYRKAPYVFPGDTKVYKTLFIASALCEQLKVEKLYLIGTAKSMWEEVYEYFSNASKTEIDVEYWNQLG